MLIRIRRILCVSCGQEFWSDEIGPHAHLENKSVNDKLDYLNALTNRVLNRETEDSRFFLARKVDGERVEAPQLPEKNESKE